MQRKSVFLSNRLNRRRSASCALSDEINITKEPTSPSILLRTTPNESTPPHKTYSLDESIEFSPPTFLNSSFSPNTLQSQAFENSEVSWKWGQKVNSNNEHMVDSIVTTPAQKNQQIPKRQKFLKDIESKIRKAENTRTDEMLKRRCAKFRVKMLGNENLKPQKNVLVALKEQQEQEPIKCTATVETCIENVMPQKNDNIGIPQNSIDDFFNDADTDDFLLEATQLVEHDIIRLTQTQNDNNLSTPKSKKNHEEKQSSIYKKFLEDDMSDDIFGSLDEIIENAMKDTRPKNLFQRFNSLPVESHSPKSTKSKTSTIKEEVVPKDVQTVHINSKTDFKRHASCHDVPIYYPQKPKQARRT